VEDAEKFTGSHYTTGYHIRHWGLVKVDARSIRGSLSKKRESPNRKDGLK